MRKQDEVAKAIINKTITVKAKDETQAIQKLNKALKVAEGYGYKIYQSRGFFGKYVLGKTYCNHYAGTDFSEFNLTEVEEGMYGIQKTESTGYNGID